MFLLNLGTEESGKAAACQGCPNQKICAAAGPAKPDPDVKLIAGKIHILISFHAITKKNSVLMVDT